MAVTRAQLVDRAVVLAADRAGLVSGLEAVASGLPADGVVRGRAGVGSRAAFVFPGQGGQWEGMAAELWDRVPVFGESMGVCSRALGGVVDWSLESVVRGEDGAPGLDRVDANIALLDGRRHFRQQGGLGRGQDRIVFPVVVSIATRPKLFRAKRCD